MSQNRKPFGCRMYLVICRTMDWRCVVYRLYGSYMFLPPIYVVCLTKQNLSSCFTVIKNLRRVSVFFACAKLCVCATHMFVARYWCHAMSCERFNDKQTNKYCEWQPTNKKRDKYPSMTFVITHEARKLREKYVSQSTMFFEIFVDGPVSQLLFPA